jgi:putative Holliday junction resolvase
MDLTSAPHPIQSPVIALDLGAKRVGVAISDRLLISINRLDALPRTNWKQLLRDVEYLIRHYDAQTVVIGLPLKLNGSDGDAAIETRRLAANFARSLSVPVYLQDERLTSVEAEQNLRLAGHNREQISAHVDSEAAAIILGDFLGSGHARTRIPSDISLIVPNP